MPLSKVNGNVFEPAIDITSGIVNSFVAFCKQNDIDPVILILPVYWGAFKAGVEFDEITAKLDDPSNVLDARSILLRHDLNSLKA